MDKVVASKMIFIFVMCAVMVLSLAAVRGCIWHDVKHAHPTPQKSNVSPRESNTSPIQPKYTLEGVKQSQTHSESNVSPCVTRIVKPHPIRDIAYIPPVRCDLKNKKSDIADVSLLDRFPSEYLPVGDTTYRVRPVIGGYEVIKGYYRFDTIIVK